MISSTVLFWLLIFALSQFFSQMLISIASDAKRFLVSVSTNLAILKVDSEDIIVAGGVSKSRAMMKSTRYVNSCDFHHVKISKFLNSESASISGVIAQVE